MSANLQDTSITGPLRLARYVPANAAHVLDCACGSGTLGMELKKTTGRRVAGIESDAAAAALAKNALDEVVCGDQYRVELPWSDATFDCALADGLLPRMRDPAPLLSGVFRVLKPGGLVAMTAPNIQYFEHFLMLARGRWQLGGDGALAPGHIRFFTAISLAALFQTAGFTQVRCGVLDTALPGEFPLDETRHAVFDDLRIGPIGPDQHKAFLAREYIVLATKPN